MSATKRTPKTSKADPAKEETDAQSLGDVSQRELARLLNVDEKALRNWIKARPDAPPVSDVDAWKKYAHDNNLGKGACNKTIAELRAEKLAVETRLLHLKEQQAKGELVEVAEVRAYLAQLGAKFDQLLTQKIDTELPPRVLGKEIVGIRAEVLATHDEIRAAVNSGISQWTPPPV